MSVDDRPNDQDILHLAIRAYALIRVDVRLSLVVSCPFRRATVALVRRLLAAGCDAEDCVIADHGMGYRREVFALARAVRQLTEEP